MEENQGLNNTHDKEFDIISQGLSKAKKSGLETEFVWSLVNEYKTTTTANLNRAVINALHEWDLI